MATYSLLVHDLRTNQFMDRLAAQGVTCDDYIGKTGSLTATLAVPNSAAARQIREAALPGRTIVYLERWDGAGSTIVWGGILWTLTPTRDARGVYTCQIQAAGLESYLRSHRLLLADLVAAGADQLAIARQIVTFAQAASGGDLGIEMDPTQTSGVLRDRTYSRYDLPWLGDLIDQLAATQDGFEWRIQTYRDGSNIIRRALRLGYPKLVVGGSPIVLSSLREITSYSLPQDATVQANSWQSRGASTNSDAAAESLPLMSTLLTSPSDIAAGWPLLEGTSDYSTVETLPVLDQHAAADLARALRPVTIPSVKLTGTTPPQLGSSVRLRITDTWHYDPLDALYRVIGWKVEPEERGRPETVELYLEAA